VSPQRSIVMRLDDALVILQKVWCVQHIISYQHPVVRMLSPCDKFYMHIIILWFWAIHHTIIILWCRVIVLQEHHHAVIIRWSACYHHAISSTCTSSSHHAVIIRWSACYHHAISSTCTSMWHHG